MINDILLLLALAFCIYALFMIHKQKDSKFHFYKIQNKKISDYTSLGIAENKIIKVSVPCFTFNTKEKKIVNFPHSYEVVNNIFQPKKDNVMIFLKSYTQIPTSEITNMINSNFIFIMEETESVSNSDSCVYRFAVV